MEKKEYKCICGREFNNSQAFNGHKSRCKIHQLQKYGNLNNYYNTKQRQIETRHRNIKIKNLDKLKDKLDLWISEQHKCEKCGKVMTEYYGSGRFCSKACANSHIYSEETKRKISESLFYKNSKKEKKLCLACGKKLNNYNKSGYCKICYHKYNKVSNKTRQKLRESALKNNFGGPHRHTIEYNNSILGSSYELQVAESLDKNNIKWTQCKKFKYYEENDINKKYHYYTPDFYLPEYDVYLDPKNDFLINNNNPSLGYKDTDKIKWVELYNNIKIIILDKNHLVWDKIKEIIK